MKHLKVGLATAFMLLLLTGTAFAAAHGADAPLLERPEINIIFRIATLGIVLFIIWHYAGKSIKAFFAGRSKSIADEISGMQARKEAATAQLAEVEKRIANLEAERQAILAEYRAQGEALKATILEKAEKSAAQITSQAKRSAENEINQALERMRAEMADLIVDATEKLLKERLSAQEHEKLIDKYLTKVVLN